MLQIIIWLGAVYLVFKGQELQQIAAASMHENRDENLKRARTWNGLAWVAAVIFVLLSIAQGDAIPTPRF